MLQRDNDQWHSRHVFLSPAVSAHPLFLLSHWMVFPPRRWSRRRSLRNSKCARPSPRWPKSTELMWEKCPPGWIGYWNEYWNDYPICCDANPGHTKYEFSMVAFAIGQPSNSETYINFVFLWGPWSCQIKRWLIPAFYCHLKLKATFCLVYSLFMFSPFLIG